MYAAELIYYCDDCERYHLAFYDYNEKGQLMRGDTMDREEIDRSMLRSYAVNDVVDVLTSEPAAHWHFQQYEQSEVRARRHDLNNWIDEVCTDSEFAAYEEAFQVGMTAGLQSFRDAVFSNEDEEFMTDDAVDAAKAAVRRL